MQNRPIVYSTDGPPDAVARPKRAARHSRATASRPPPPDDRVVRIFRERPARGGKPLTVVRGLKLPRPQVEALAAELKRLCGAGGGVRDGAIELQGDQRQKTAAFLTAKGYRVKLAGG